MQDETASGEQRKREEEEREITQPQGPPELSPEEAENLTEVADDHQVKPEGCRRGPHLKQQREGLAYGSA